MELPQSLAQKVASAGQEHLFRFWAELDESQQRMLLRDVEGIDFERLKRLLSARSELSAGGTAKDRAERAQSPSKLIRQPTGPSEREAWKSAAAVGRELLAQGKVGAILVAGGQGLVLVSTSRRGCFRWDRALEKRCISGSPNSFAAGPAN